MSFDTVITNEDAPSFGVSDWDRVKKEIIRALGPDRVYRAFEECGVVFSEDRTNTKGWRKCWAVDREETRPSADVHPERALYYDFGGSKKPIHLFDFALYHGSGRFGRWIDACKHYAELAGVEVGKPQYGKDGKIKDGQFDYVDPDGHKRYRSYRYIFPKGGKDFSQTPIDDSGKVLKYGRGAMEGVDPLPYRLPELLASDPETQVCWIVEGEKKTDLLISNGLVSTTSHGGHNSTDRTWPRFDPAWFRGRHCVLLPDNDPGGRNHMQSVAKWLRSAGAASIRIVELPGLLHGCDVGDWLDHDGTTDDLYRLAHEAPEWEPDQVQEAPVNDRRWADLSDIRRLRSETRWLWDRWIASSGTCGIAGLEGTGKTRLAMDLFRRTHLGLEWPDGSHMTAPPGVPSIWVCSDAHQTELVDMAEAFGLPDHAVKFATPPSDPYGSTDIDDRDVVDMIEEAVKDIKPTFVFIDTLTSATMKDLSDQRSVKPLGEIFSKLAQKYGVTIVLLLHMNQQGQALGRRIRAITRTLMHLECPDEENPTRLRLWIAKTFDVRPEQALGLTMGSSGNAYDTNAPDKIERGGRQGGKAARSDPASVRCREFTIATITARQAVAVVDLLREWVEAGGSESTFWRVYKQMQASKEVFVDGSPKMLRLTGVVPEADVPF